MAIFKAKKDTESKPDMKKVVADSGIRHIAFIMDGNGRWANNRGLPREAGHGVGSRVFKSTVTLCRDWGIKTVTTYAFSTENWKRPPQEVKEIMRLLDVYIADELWLLPEAPRYVSSCRSSSSISLFFSITICSSSS